MELEINQQDLKEAFELLERTGANMEKATPRVISDALTETYRQVKNIVRDEGIAGGLYDKSIRMSPVEQAGGTFQGTVGNAARNPRTGYGYPQGLEEGTGIYGPKGQKITPNVAKCLHFFAKDGTEVFTRSVKGMKPKHIFKRAREFASKRIAGLIKEFLQKAGRL